MKNGVRKIFIICALLLWAFLAINATQKTLSALFFDLDGQENFPVAAEALRKILSTENPDIAIFAGVKDKASLEDILRRSPSYAYSFLAEAGESGRLALISKITPIDCRLEKPSYKIRNEMTGAEADVHALGGFIYAKFAVGDYEFSLLAAHLKSKEPHPDFNQFDMRRYEARQLRYVFDDIIKAEPEANVMLLGNFNDTCEMSTIKEIYARRYGYKKRLFDIRPVDDLLTSWTHWNHANDEYERISYALASHSMLPEISREKTRIIRTDDWLKLSPHRPLIVSFTTEDMEEHSDEYIATIYPNNIHSETTARLEKDRIIGKKPKRKPPSPQKKPNYL